MKRTRCASGWTMSANTRFIFLVGLAASTAACSSDTESPFTNGCASDQVLLPDGGCRTVVPSTGGTTGTGGLGSGGTGTGGAGAPGSGGAATGGGGGLTTGGAGPLPDSGTTPDASTNGCPISGGGPSLTPPGACTVLAFCNRIEFRLVCRDGQPTCDCKTRGVTTHTVPNDRDFCALADGGSRVNIAEANQACGWDLDTSGLRQ